MSTYSANANALFDQIRYSNDPQQFSRSIPQLMEVILDAQLAGQPLSWNECAAMTHLARVWANSPVFPGWKQQGGAILVEFFESLIPFG